MSAEAAALPRAAAGTASRSVALSKWLVFLLAIRPVINQARGDTSLLTLGDYNVSILSVWSLAFMAVALARLRHGPRAPIAIRRSIFAFFFVVLAFGVPRIYLREALVYDVLTFFEFFLAALTARGVLDDVGIDYVVGRVSAGALVLVVMHATASAWMPFRDVETGDITGNYVGGFESKHIAGASFFALLPFLICAALKNRRSLGAYLVIPTALFLVLALQRVAIVSAVVLGLVIIVFARRVRVFIPLVVTAALVVMVIPSDRFQDFVESKIEEDLDAYQSGDLESVGAGRMAIVFLAEKWFEDSSLIDQAVGRGTAQAYELHLIAVGHLAYAHIEVVELVIDYGVIGTGIVFLILFLIGREKLAQYRKTNRPEELIGIAMTVVVFSQLFYAMPLQDGGTVTLLAFWLFPPANKPQSLERTESSMIVSS